MEFRDVGAVVWILRKYVWWVPDFAIDTYRNTLVQLDAEMHAAGPLVAHSAWHLIEARRPAAGEPSAYAPHVAVAGRPRTAGAARGS